MRTVLVTISLFCAFQLTYAQHALYFPFGMPKTAVYTQLTTYPHLVFLDSTSQSNQIVAKFPYNEYIYTFHKQKLYATAALKLYTDKELLATCKTAVNQYFQFLVGIDGSTHRNGNELQYALLEDRIVKYQQNKLSASTRVSLQTFSFTYCPKSQMEQLLSAIRNSKMDTWGYESGTTASVSND